MDHIIFSNKDDKKVYLFKLSRRNNEDWIITIGNWEELEGRKRFQTIEDVMIGKQGFLDLLKEFKRILLTKPKEEQILKIAFLHNEPELVIKGQYIYTDSSNYSPYTVNKFEISAGFNLNHSATKDTREEMQYLYENGGLHTFLIYNFTEEELLEFIRELEKEIDVFSERNV